METKFAVGQVWKNREGVERRIIAVSDDCHYPVYSNSMDGIDGTTHTINGKYFHNGDDLRDLVVLVTNADGTPATAEAAAAQIEPRVFDPTRTEFIDKLTHELFACEYYAADDAATRLRAAVKVRDELVRGGQ